ncbi:hypothetical protein AWM70_05105 [Paenibacillus yonginensis]|uniref:RNA polymerase subunit sigma n=1 Tax=Paenibacillus yonginensis TaxID=1462996 RepID=A0A1B1MXY2_9BACL|nr:hypothetical protein [Paenibacillus yonginensis]ANS74025.1 hypothetical protein AWM70_05105 [Paenibacillus yonginensis]
MDLKPVELQIAVPRTSEAGRIQQEQQFRPTVDQQQLAAQNVKDSELQRTRSSEVDDSAKSERRERESSDSADRDERQTSRNRVEEKQGQQPEPHLAEHPYKGKHIDFSF